MSRWFDLSLPLYPYDYDFKGNNVHLKQNISVLQEVLLFLPKNTIHLQFVIVITLVSIFVLVMDIFYTRVIFNIILYSIIMANLFCFHSYFIKTINYKNTIRTF